LSKQNKLSTAAPHFFRVSFMNFYSSIRPPLDIGGWTVALQALHVDENQGKQLASLTSLVVGVTTPPRKCRVLHLHSWPEGTVKTCTIYLLYILVPLPSA
jgi:hypothetical protein